MESINNGGLNTVELKRDIYKRLLSGSGKILIRFWNWKVHARLVKTI